MSCDGSSTVTTKSFAIACIESDREFIAHNAMNGVPYTPGVIMSENKKDDARPLVRLEMDGDVQFPVCKTCAQLYIGELSEDQGVKNDVSRMVETAIRENESVVVLKLREIEYRPLRPAITIGQSVYDRTTTTLIPDPAGKAIPTEIFIDPPGPVCWVHIQGFRPTRDMVQDPNDDAGSGIPPQRTSPLIPGKSHKNVRSQ